MSKISATEFVEKFYDDDEFLKEFCRNGGVTKKASDEEKKEAVLSASRKMGYDFTYQEYLDANGEYFKGKGLWFGIKKLVHIARVSKAALKEKK